jgi:hypothetical protein
MELRQKKTGINTEASIINETANYFTYIYIYTVLEKRNIYI